MSWLDEAIRSLERMEKAEAIHLNKIVDAYNKIGTAILLTMVINSSERLVSYQKSLTQYRKYRDLQLKE